MFPGQIVKIATPLRKAEDKALNKSRELGVNKYSFVPNGNDTSMLVDGKIVLPKIGYQFQDMFDHYKANIERIYKEQRKSDKRAEINNDGTMLTCKFNAWIKGYKKYDLDKISNRIDVEWDEGYKT